MHSSRCCAADMPGVCAHFDTCMIWSSTSLCQQEQHTATGIGGFLYFVTQVLLLGAAYTHRSWVFKTWREYFHFSYLNEATLDPEKTYIFVEFPHGVFPMSELIAGETSFGVLRKECIGVS